MKDDLSQEFLKSILEYNQDTGEFFWINPKRSWVAPGTKAGSVEVKGYVVININGGLYKAHRLAWLYVYGEWPKNQLDHIDRNKQNNRIGNLRQATNGQNQQNTPKYRTKALVKSKYKGVSWREQSKKWQVEIQVNKKRYNLGMFVCEEDAAIAYLEAKKKLHPYAVFDGSNSLKVE